MSLPELPDDRRAQPRRYGSADPKAAARPPGPPGGARPGPPPSAPWSIGPAPRSNGHARPEQPPAPEHPRPSPAVGRRPPDANDDASTVVHDRIVDASAAEPDRTPEPSPEVPGRHRRRADEDPDARSAAGDREPDEAKGGRRGGPVRRRRMAFWKELPLLIVVALLLTFLIQTFLAKVYVIPSGSMETTLHGCTGCNNDRVLVDKVTYRFSQPEPGDVVVFRGPDSWSSEVTYEPPPNALVAGLQQLGSLIGLAPPDEKDFVKRVIAVGGQTVQCCDSGNRVTVDDQPLDESYVYFLPSAGEAVQQDFGPITVPDGQLWMMGDSRNNSADSRVPGHGPIPVANVIGKARLVVLPFPRFGVIGGGNPQTADAMAADAGVLPVVGLIGMLPLAARRRRDELDVFLPAPARRR